jgi:class 3 adenylate cyclase
MAIKEKLENEVKATFQSAWEVQTATVVPAAEDLRLNANHAKDLATATILYADLDGSTNMVDTHQWEFSAEIYKTFLRCAGEIIRSEGGNITAYDGDRIMAVFTGDSKNTTAARCALKINWAVKNIIQPALDRQYPGKGFTVQHVVGIDTSRLRTARIGVRGDNDLVWIGRAANYAAKLTSLAGKPTWITKAVYDSLADTAKYASGVDMWRPHTWNEMGGLPIYSSTYWWRFD